MLGAPAALAGHAGQAVAAAAAGAVGHSATESVMASVDALDVPLVGVAVSVLPVCVFAERGRSWHMYAQRFC